MKIIKTTYKHLNCKNHIDINYLVELWKQWDWKKIHYKKNQYIKVGVIDHTFYGTLGASKIQWAKIDGQIDNENEKHGVFSWNMCNYNSVFQ